MKRFWSETHYLFHLLRVGTKSASALRASFWIQIGVMFFQNFIFLSIWFFFFQKFQEIRGWKMSDYYLLFGIANISFGMLSIFFGGAFRLSEMIITQGIEPYMTQPKSILIQTIGSDSKPSGWGDIFSGLVMFGLSGYASFKNWPYLILIILTSFFLMTATTIIIHSLVFWVRSLEQMTESMFFMFMHLCVQPNHIFQGMLKLIIYTIVPVAFISTLPVEMIRSNSPSYLGVILIATFLYSSIAVFIFYKGLQRYESGNQFSLKG